MQQQPLCFSVKTHCCDGFDTLRAANNFQNVPFQLSTLSEDAVGFCLPRS